LSFLGKKMGRYDRYGFEINLEKTRETGNQLPEAQKNMVTLGPEIHARKRNRQVGTEATVPGWGIIMVSGKE